MSKKALCLPCKLSVAISVLRAFVLITDMVEIAISASDHRSDYRYISNASHGLNR